MQLRGGGAERDRTVDPLLAKQVLSQLSYSPNFWEPAAEMVGLGRFELPTSPLSGVRSNQLSYRPGLASLSPAILDDPDHSEPFALDPSSCIRKGFEDKVERTGRLRRP